MFFVIHATASVASVPIECVAVVMAVAAVLVMVMVVRVAVCFTAGAFDGPIACISQVRPVVCATGGGRPMFPSISIQAQKLIRL